MRRVSLIKSNVDHYRAILSVFTTGLCVCLCSLAPCALTQLQYCILERHLLELLLRGTGEPFAFLRPTVEQYL